MNNKEYMRRIKIEEKFKNLFYGNGGHWLDLKLKSGEVLKIRRRNMSYFEDLDKEEFYVNDNTMTFDELIDSFMKM